MPEQVPTYEEFDALVKRVEFLEADRYPPQPDTGRQAKRIADLISLFGVNTFSSLDSGNLWGSWPADYQPDTVIAALQFILGDSGHAFRIREYHYAGRETMQRPWLAQVTAAFPGTQVALCVAANGSVEDVPTMLQIA